jgi:hypothetical protein
MLRKKGFRVRVAATKTDVVGTAVDGDGLRRCSRARRAWANLRSRKMRVRERKVQRIQRAREGSQRRAVATATFTPTRRQPTVSSKNSSSRVWGWLSPLLMKKKWWFGCSVTIGEESWGALAIK